MAYHPILIAAYYNSEGNTNIALVDHTGDAGEQTLRRTYEFTQGQTLAQMKNVVIAANTALNNISIPTKVTQLQSLIGQEVS